MDELIEAAADPGFDDDKASLRVIRAKLLAAYDAVAGTRLVLPAALPVDTAFALVEALGTLAKARALVGRDLDTLGRRRP